MFRIGSMGEVNEYHVMRTLSSIASVMNILGLKVSPDATSVALKKLETIM